MLEAILVVFSLLGLFIGIVLTQPGLANASSEGHFFVVTSILPGATGAWLIWFGNVLR